MKIAFVGVEGTPSGDLTGVRQALVAYASSDSPTVPQAMGAIECDTDGDALMGRTVHASAADTATTSPAQALAAYSKRVEAIIQNVDDDGGVLLVYLADHATAAFKVLPGGTFVWRGADEIFVVTATGTADWVAVER